MSNEACPFCAIDSERNRILKSRERVVVILSNPRLMPGHTLVIPRRHVTSFTALTVDELGDLFGTAIHFQEKLKEVFTELWGVQAGCDLSQHDRPFMPTDRISVPIHLHIHLRPRGWCDGYYQEVLRHETAMFRDMSLAEKKKFQLLLGE
jgi:diadenosine tetraphosphate (Ap4A) HIT family hydrolase